MKAIYRASSQVSTGKVNQKRTAIMQMSKKRKIEKRRRATRSSLPNWGGAIVSLFPALLDCALKDWSNLCGLDGEGHCCGPQGLGFQYGLSEDHEVD